jgi:hypothetical protein
MSWELLEPPSAAPAVSSTVFGLVRLAQIYRLPGLTALVIGKTRLNTKSVLDGPNVVSSEGVVA